MVEKSLNISQLQNGNSYSIGFVCVCVCGGGEIALKIKKKGHLGGAVG